MNDDKLKELSDFMDEMLNRLEKDFPFLANAKKTDGNVIYVDFRKEDDEL